MLTAPQPAPCARCGNAHLDEARTPPLERARAAGRDTSLLSAAYTHLKAYENRRASDRNRSQFALPLKTFVGPSRVGEGAT
jgi:hypothetical protein